MEFINNANTSLLYRVVRWISVRYVSEHARAFLPQALTLAS